ncbi:hypothetical protein IWZ01DRAFT_483352 [Phyllosticta capitalensis]
MQQQAFAFCQWFANVVPSLSAVLDSRGWLVAGWAPSSTCLGFRGEIDVMTVLLCGGSWACGDLAIRAFLDYIPQYHDLNENWNARRVLVLILVGCEVGCCPEQGGRACNNADGETDVFAVASAREVWSYEGIVGKYLHEKWSGHRVLYNQPSSSEGTVAQPGEKEKNNKMPQ